jgi:glycosyltransferase involved in cell wall biosynthesis
LILNWRDVRHPRAGGAEVLTHEHARRLVERGHEVTLFASAVAGASAAETIDGVDVVRRGSAVTTRLHAVHWYRAQRRASPPFDVVVEQVNTLPYLAERYARVPTVLWMHQLAREVWWYEAPRAVAGVGYLAEEAYGRLRRRLPAIVLSESTRLDLVRLGFDPEAVAVVPPGVKLPSAERTVEKERGLLIYVGRLAASKRVDHLVTALARVREGGVDARLAIVGRGTERERARVLVRADDLGIRQHVTLTGFLDEDAKQALVARAELLVMASVREGWGLVVTEANAVGTPAVVYDRPGLRDSTRHGETGLITSPNPTALAEAVVRAVTDRDLYERLRAEAIQWSRHFSWERASGTFERALRAVARGSQEHLSAIGVD